MCFSLCLRFLSRLRLLSISLRESLLINLRLSITWLHHWLPIAWLHHRLSIAWLHHRLSVAWLYHRLSVAWLHHRLSITWLHHWLSITWLYHWLLWVISMLTSKSWLLETWLWIALIRCSHWIHYHFRRISSSVRIICLIDKSLWSIKLSLKFLLFCFNLSPHLIILYRSLLLLNSL